MGALAADADHAAAALGGDSGGLGERMRAIARRINEEYNVEALCREFPGRIQKLIDLGGDNLKK